MAPTCLSDVFRCTNVSRYKKSNRSEKRTEMRPLAATSFISRRFKQKTLQTTGVRLWGEAANV